MNSKTFFALMLIAAFVTQAAARVGGVQTDWAQVQRLAVGTTIKVDTKGKKSYRGKVEQIDDSSMRMTLEGGQTQSLKRDDVTRVYRFEKDKGSRAKAAGIFGAIGAGVGLGIGGILLGATGGSDETGKVLAPFVLAGAGVGAGLGAALGLGDKKILIYKVN